MFENRRNRRIGVLAMLVAVAPVVAEAHVKWFYAISDVTAPPVMIGAVVTPRFVAIAVLFVLYPEWTLFVIGTHPSLAAGFPPGFVVVMAGFIECTLAFYFMTGRGLVRFGAAAFASILIAAIPEFGHLDSVGHLSIVGIMAVVCLRGASPLQRLFGLLGRRPLTNAAGIAALYVVVLIGFFGAYYGLQWSEYGAG